MRGEAATAPPLGPGLRRTSGLVREPLEAGAGQEVTGCDGGGICPYKLDQSGTGALGSERLAELVEVLLYGLAAAGRLRLGCRPTEVGERGDPG
jgi:hypothetical protein